jgi:hypothetical protein
MYRIRFHGCGGQGVNLKRTNGELVPLLLGLICYIALGLAIIVRSLRHMHNP